MQPNMKKIVVYFTNYPHNATHTMQGALAQVVAGCDDIHTTWTGLLDTKYLELGYRLFYDISGKVNECKLGENTWTRKDIMTAHNIEKIVRAHVYSEIVDTLLVQ